MKGVGIHCFAGGFTMGMKQVHNVDCQLEIHNFGRETCEAHGTKFMNADTWQGWQEYKSDWEGCSFCYGNPRCTSFSSYSAGCNDEVRGAYAASTRDIWDLIEFGLKAKLELIAFESVQQCYSVGRPLLNALVKKLKCKHYRVAHLFVNTAAEGNSQKRCRYFFVAYKDNHNFNIELPKVPKYLTTVGDVLEPFLKHKVVAGLKHGKDTDYAIDTYPYFKDREMNVIRHLLEGETIHSMALKRPEVLAKVSPFHYEIWETRISDLPFSLHQPTRLKWDGSCPTISSTSHNFIHPRFDRACTIGEIAALMGWPKGFIPVGPQPIGQIGKGVVPATGKWLGEQIEMYFNNHWGDEDFSLEYCRGDNLIYETHHANKPTEKVFRITGYIPNYKE